MKVLCISYYFELLVVLVSLSGELYLLNSLLFLDKIFFNLLFFCILIWVYEILFIGRKIVLSFGLMG